MSPSSPLPNEETQAFEPSGGGAPHRTGDLIDARYDLKEAIGGGVMATVWQAHDRVLGRDVAVKLWNDDSADAIHSQQDELAAARLINPNLNEVLDAGRHRGRPYLVSELLGQPDEPRAAPATLPEPPEQPARRESTPPAGQPALPRRKTDRTVGIVVAVLILAVALVAFGILGPSPDRESGGPDSAAPIVPAGVASFDPEGDGAENPGEVGAVLDGNPSTAWSTDLYNSRLFGNLKSGVGLVLTLPAPAEVESIEIDTAEGGWSAAVYGAATPQAALAAWGQPMAQLAEAERSEEFDVQGRTVGAVLIWFTDLGPRTNRLTVSEVRLVASP